MADSTPVLILASASPRRSQLLESAGFAFVVRPADVDESSLPGEDPSAYVRRIAYAKAAKVAADCRESGSVVLAADTAVVIDGETLGKPIDDRDAARMLKLLSGRVHDVLTGVVVMARGQAWSEVVRTQVRLLPLRDYDIRWYVETREPDGKAGAYAIQGIGARFVDWIEGSWSNVVGLPIATVDQLLKRVGA